MKKLLAILLALSLLFSAYAFAESGDEGYDEEIVYPIDEILDALGSMYRSTYEALLNGEVIKNGSKSSTVKGVQKTLSAFGPEVATDGKFAAKTLKVLNAVQATFGLERTKTLDAEGYAALLPGLLVTVDPDAADEILYYCMDYDAYQYLRACSYIALGKYATARSLFEESEYGDWEARAKNCEQKWPKNGVLYKNPAVKGSNTELVIKFNAEKGTAMLVKIYTTKGVLARTLFIGGTGKASTRLPAGGYIIKDGTGKVWYGEDEAFGEEGDYEIMTFNGGTQAIKLQKNYRTTITVNVKKNDPNSDSVGSDWESWEDF